MVESHARIRYAKALRAGLIPSQRNRPEPFAVLAQDHRCVACNGRALAESIGTLSKGNVQDVAKACPTLLS